MSSSENKGKSIPTLGNTNPGMTTSSKRKVRNVVEIEIEGLKDNHSKTPRNRRKQKLYRSKLNYRSLKSPTLQRGVRSSLQENPKKARFTNPYEVLRNVIIEVVTPVIKTKGKVIYVTGLINPAPYKYDESEILTNIDGYLITDGTNITITLRSSLNENQKQIGKAALLKQTTFGDVGVYLWNIEKDIET